MKALPEKTLEIPYLQSQEAKIELMKLVNEVLDKQVDFKIDQERDYSAFFNVVTKVLD